MCRGAGTPSPGGSPGSPLWLPSCELTETPRPHELTILTFHAHVMRPRRRRRGPRRGPGRLERASPSAIGRGRAFPSSVFPSGRKERRSLSPRAIDRGTSAPGVERPSSTSSRIIRPTKTHNPCVPCAMVPCGMAHAAWDARGGAFSLSSLLSKKKFFLPSLPPSLPPSPPLLAPRPPSLPGPGTLGIRTRVLGAAPSSAIFGFIKTKYTGSFGVHPPDPDAAIPLFSLLGGEVRG